MRELIILMMLPGACSLAAQEPVFKYDTEATAWYRCSMNNGSVLVELKLTDTVAQEKLLRNGAELWFDPRGKKNKKTCIAFPLAVVQPARGRTEQAGHPPDLKDLIANAREMKLTGFSESINGVQNQYHPSGISAGVRFLNDTLIYQVQLPLNILTSLGELTSRLAIGIVIRGSGQLLAGFPPDGPMDGGPPAGPAPGTGAENVRLLDDDEFWCKLVVFRADEQRLQHIVVNADKNK